MSLLIERIKVALEHQSQDPLSVSERVLLYKILFDKVYKAQGLSYEESVSATLRLVHETLNSFSSVDYLLFHDLLEVIERNTGRFQLNTDLNERASLEVVLLRLMQTLIAIQRTSNELH